MIIGFHRPFDHADRRVDRTGRSFLIDLSVHRGTLKYLLAAPISGGRHYFRCGAVTLAVYSPAGDGDSTQPRANFGHVYFSTEDLEACYTRAQAVGGLSREIGDGGLPMGEIVKRPWGERSFYVDDPFGNPLCFVDASTLFKGPPA